MLLSWFDAKEAKEFGASLARFHIEKIPLAEPGKKSRTPAKQQESLKKLLQQMERYKLEHKLNIYKKAQLGNAFKWTLKEAGYDTEYVDQLTKQLMLVR
jgi:hypothetical protein